MFIYHLNLWSWRLESNPQPADYKSAALPIELRQHLRHISRRSVIMFTLVDYAIKRWYRVGDSNPCMPP